MLMQYLDYKDRYPDCLLFFQVGDFFELFFEDAKTVAKVINLTLTSRDKNSSNPVPMCGVPIGVADTYAERLVAGGFSVAMVRQAEAATGKGMVARKLDRIITPGIRVLGAADADASDAKVVAVQLTGQSDVAIAFSDIQSGKVNVREGFNLESLYAEIARLSPTEVILPKQLAGKVLDRRIGWVKSIESIVKFGNIKFRSDTSASQGSRSGIGEIPGYKSLSPTGKRATAFLISYIDETTVSSELQISAIETKSYDDVVSIDATTRINLELVRNSKDASTRGTLLEFLQKTVSPGGARLLREWVLSPLKKCDQIAYRHKIVSEFISDQHRLTGIRNELSKAPDIERIATRIELGIVTPRELGALRDLLLLLPAFIKSLSGMTAWEMVQELPLPDLKQLSEKLEVQLVDLPPLSLNDGQIIKRGFDEALDHLITVSEKGKEWIVDLETKEKEATGISSLKIRFNNVFGYYIEITNSNVSKAPSRYIRKQTTSNSERYITEELKQREEEVLGAGEKRVKLEKSLFETLRRELVGEASLLRELAGRLSALDVLAAFAYTALSQSLIQPELNEGANLEIVKGRHPQLSELLGSAFIPNSAFLESGGQGCVILTGPNMGGKSTYLRQTALIVILAQIGSFVPAERAVIGVVDRIFARLGASDDIAEGESTFMVEMREAAHIIGNATRDSLLLIDEIGRGTATTDGLAIARAILEWIVLNTKARTLFATHFHELTALADIYPQTIRNFSVASVEKDGHVIFTHEIKEGPANKSYGIEVARLAGLPKPLLVRAREILGELSTDQAKRDMSAVRQLTIFDAPLASTLEVPKDYAGLTEIRDMIERCPLNETTPLAALQLLSELQAKLAQ